MKKPLLISAVIVLGLVGLTVSWYLLSPLFINQSVDEAFPIALPEESELADLSAEEAELILEDAMEDEMPETSPEAEWILLSQGQFRDADDFHQGSGMASIFKQGDQIVLRFEEFKVTNGPDLHVLLVENIAGTNHETIGNFVDLGSLKGNMGSQNYEIISDVDLSEYEGVLIYCMPFHVVFATAPLDQ